MDDKLFRQAMGRFATGVTVITTKVGEDVHGMTANAFMSISLDPKLVTISIDNKAAMLDKIKKSGKYAVSFLGKEQQNISMHFAGQKKEENPIDFELMDQDMPVIENALSSVVCDVDRTIEVGDHTLFIGKVKDIHVREGEPLLFFGGKYGSYQENQYVK
ncbi:flavin reductase family protein [Aquibacillus sediminis]|uniref:flavin reductase family protein n=1 Tax=Aquibacillus sediminis TaxID=2574734 RepID=UPI001108E025|nr:flavin reductase family protein [Aquibacillus sediminis]